MKKYIQFKTTDGEEITAPLSSIIIFTFKRDRPFGGNTRMVKRAYMVRVLGGMGRFTVTEKTYEKLIKILKPAAV